MQTRPPDSPPQADGPAAGARGFFLALGVGLALTVAQIGVACAASGRPTFAEAYDALFNWDSDWYADIAVNGYHALDLEEVARRGVESTDPESGANAAFMPGFALFGRLVLRLTGLPVRAGILVAAQLACWAAWTYLVLLLRRWRLPAHLAALGVGLVLVHPGAFFLVAGYSEPLYLAALLGFFYWLDRPGRAAVALAAAHGFVLGATRLFGLPLALYPLARALFRRGDEPGGRWAGAAAVSAATGLGGLLFFAYCRFALGRWDQHMATLRLFWAVEPDYLALLSPQIWHVDFPRGDNGFLDPDSYSRLLVPLTLLTFAGLLGLEAWLARGGRETGWRRRWGLYFCAALMYYINVSGRVSLKMQGMLRYDLCVYVLLVLCLVHLLAHGGFPPGRRRLAVVLLVLWCLASAVLQVGFLVRFTRGLWVA